MYNANKLWGMSIWKPTFNGEMWCIFLVLLCTKSTIDMNTMHPHDVFFTMHMKDLLWNSENWNASNNNSGMLWCNERGNQVWKNKTANNVVISFWFCGLFACPVVHSDWLWHNKHSKYIRFSQFDYFDGNGSAIFFFLWICAEKWLKCVTVRLTTVVDSLVVKSKLLWRTQLRESLLHQLALQGEELVKRGT